MATYGSLSHQDKKLAEICTVSVTTSQRRRTPLHATSANREDAPAVTQKKASSLRRPSKYNRLSDRWPVLNRIMRTSKPSVVSRKNPPCPDDWDASGSDSEDDDEEDCIIVTQPVNMRTVLTSVRYKTGHSHPTSPKFPSPLSGVRPVKRLLLTRHNYPHRGYSQSALHHQRELWRRRKSEWDDYEYMLYQAGLSIEDVYGGMVEDASGCSHSLAPPLKYCPRNGRSSSMPLKDSLHIPELLNPATFPRLGDLSAARDPFLMSVDIWFADFPLWTLSKLIWIYDVNHRSGRAVRQNKQKWPGNTFMEDFDVGDLSADTLSNSYADLSGSTLVDSAITTSRYPEVNIKDQSRSKTLLEQSLISPATLHPMPSLDTQYRPWEKCWFSRWEVLYNQISLAADIAASSGDPSPSANGSKEATRILLTAAHVLYDPHFKHIKERNSENSLETAANVVISGSRRVVPLAVDEEDDDYGDVIRSSGSIYRFGAQVDPLSMFATATTDYLGSPDADIANSNFVTEHFSKDYASEIVCGIQQLAICS